MCLNFQYLLGTKFRPSAGKAMGSQRGTCGVQIGGLQQHMRSLLRCHPQHSANKQLCLFHRIYVKGNFKVDKNILTKPYSEGFAGFRKVSVGFFFIPDLWESVSRYKPSSFSGLTSKTPSAL